MVSVCAWLTNFQPALVPCGHNYEEVEDEVDKYFVTHNDELTSSSSDNEDSINQDIYVINSNDIKFLLIRCCVS